MTPSRRRQNLGVDQNPNAPIAGAQVPPVTVYSIYSQVGATAAIEIYTYTQTFVAVPSQFPAAVAGTIGYGGHKKKKREAEAVPKPEINTGIAGRIAWR